MSVRLIWAEGDDGIEHVSDDYPGSMDMHCVSRRVLALTIAIILGLLTVLAPITSTTTRLLDRGRVGVSVTRFGKIARKSVFRNSSAVGETSVVTIVGLVGTGHSKVVSRDTCMSYCALALFGSGRMGVT
jgi:hypothetical protein